MANKKISELIEISELGINNYIPVAVGNNTYKIDYLYFIQSFASSQSVIGLQNQINALNGQVDYLLDIIGTIAHLNNYSMLSQNGNASGQAMPFEVIFDFNENINVIDNTKITFDVGNVFNIQFSAQFENSSTAEHDINIWLNRNGQPVEHSNTVLEIPRGRAADPTQLVAAWNFFVNDDGNTGNYYQIYWQSDSTNVKLVSKSSTGSIPATPSVILTVSKVA